MVARRKDDPPVSRTRFRTERILQDGGKWFFLTREGSIEGPFDCQDEAVEQLEVYIRLMNSGMFTQTMPLELSA